MDCLDGLKLLSDDSVDLIVTSPPYYNVKEYSHYNSYENYLDFLKRTFTLCLRKLKESRMCCVNISTIIMPRTHRNAQSRRFALPFHFVNLMEGVGYEFLEDIIWVKPEGAAKNRNGGFYKHRQPVAYKPNVVNEYVLVFKKLAAYLIDRVVRSYTGEIKASSLVTGEYERSNVWRINPDTNSQHPAPFPAELSDKLIQYYTYVNDVVLDPFMGGGTTAYSAKRLDRNYIGFELNTKYAGICEKRLTSV
jgi:DNA modification methylase